MAHILLAAPFTLATAFFAWAAWRDAGHVYGDSGPQSDFWLVMALALGVPLAVYLVLFVRWWRHRSWLALASFDVGLFALWFLLLVVAADLESRVFIAIFVALSVIAATTLVALGDGTQEASPR